MSAVSTRTRAVRCFCLTIATLGACSYPDYGFSSGAAGSGGQAGSAGLAGSGGLAGQAGGAGAGGTNLDAGDASDSLGDAGDASLGCKPDQSLTLGKAIAGTNDPLANTGNVSNAIDDYTCATKACGGFEATWHFKPSTLATYRFTLTDLDADCDLYIVGPVLCGGTCASPSASSTQKVGTTETVDVSLVADADYFVSVDGAVGVFCHFQLAVIQL